MVRQHSMWSAAALTVLMLSAARLAAAADQPSVLLEDDYSTLDPAFGDIADMMSVSDHTLTMKVEKQTTFKAFYESTLVTDADATIRVRLPKPGSNNGDAIGLAFWGFDVKHYYALAISDSDTYAVIHRVGADRTIDPVSWRKTDALKKGAGEWNELRVVAVGDRVTVYLNGQKLAQIKGRPPKDGSLIGVYAEAGNEDAKLQYSALKVVEPAKQAELKGRDPDVLYADNFTKLDPGWGSEGDRVFVKDGKFHIQAKPKMYFSLLYEGYVFDDIDYSAKVQVHDGDDKSNASVGLIFWAGDPENFFDFAVYEDKKFSVERQMGERTLRPVAAKAVPAEAKMDPAKPTELRVVLNGKKATLYINGVSVATVAGQNPDGGGQIGVYANSGDAAATCDFSDLVVRNPGEEKK